MPSGDELHVVFGTGPLGRAVVRELFSHGKRVRAINRSGKTEFPASVEVVAADAYDAEQARQACLGATVIYQCAMPPYTQWSENFPALQSNVISAASAQSAKLIVADNLYLYGEVDGPIHEGLPSTAKTKKGRIRAQMADALIEAHQTGRVRMSIGRGSDFFGPHVYNSVMGERIFLAATQGKKATAFGDLDLPHTYTFINDFGKALVTLGEHEAALGRAWHVPNGETLTTREFVRKVYDAAGTEFSISAMGPTMLRIGGLFIPAARETVEMMYEFEKPFIVDSSRYVQFFGNHATPVREAIGQTVDWYRMVGGKKGKG